MGNRTSETVKIHISQIFARFGTPKTLVFDNGLQFVSGDLKQWCQSLGIRKIESPVYHPRANGLAEKAVQTVKRALQAWSRNLNVSFGAFLQRALMTHRNTSKTRGKIPVELLLARRVRLPAIADFDLSEPILFKANEKTVISCYLHHQEGLEHIFHTARKLSKDYSSERQPNCETRRGKCKN